MEGTIISFISIWQSEDIGYAYPTTAILKSTLSSVLRDSIAKTTIVAFLI
jgi:hypothetical protein